MRNEHVFLKKDHVLYGEEGRSIRKDIYVDLPKEHQKLFITERSYRNRLEKKYKNTELPGIKQW